MAMAVEIGHEKDSMEFFCREPCKYLRHLIHDKGFTATQIRENFREKIESAAQKLCLLNYADTTRLKNLSFVCYRGFISDIKNPVYVPKLIIFRSTGGKHVHKSSIYSDILYEDCEVLCDEEGSFTSRFEYEISSFHHQNMWVNDTYKDAFEVQTSSVTVGRMRLVFHETCEQLKMEDLVEVYGVVELESGWKCGQEDTIILHCVYAKVLADPSPYCQLATANFDFMMARKHIVSALSCVFQGDALLAEYLLLCLTSHIAFRTPSSVVGRFVLNVIFLAGQMSQIRDVTQSLMQVVDAICPCSLSYSVSESDLREEQFCVVKDYDNDCLAPHSIRVTNGTLLVLDETQLTHDIVSDSAITNYNFLRDLIFDQRMTIDFKFYNLKYYKSIKVLILSQRKSIFPNDSVITWIPKKPIPFNIADCPLQLMRQYLSVVYQLNFCIDTNMQEFIKEFFINPVNKTKFKLDGCKLDSMINMARLLCASYGCEQLSCDIWSKMTAMELSRLERI